MESSTRYEKSRMTVMLIMMVLHLMVFDHRSSTAGESSASMTGNDSTTANFDMRTAITNTTALESTSEPSANMTGNDTTTPNSTTTSTAITNTTTLASKNDCCGFIICLLKNSTIIGHFELTLRSDLICNGTATNFIEWLIVLLKESVESNQTCSEIPRCTNPQITQQNFPCISFNSSCEYKIILSCINGSEVDEIARFTLILKYSFFRSNQTVNCKSDSVSISFNCTYRGHQHCTVCTLCAASGNCTDRNLTYKCFVCQKASTNNPDCGTTTTTNESSEGTTDSMNTTVNNFTEITTTDETPFSSTTPETTMDNITDQGAFGWDIRRCNGDIGLPTCLTVGSIGFAAALFLVLIVVLLNCCRKRCCKKSSSDSEDDRKKRTAHAESKNGNTLNLQSYQELDSNTSHRPLTYELVNESASPYEEATGPADTTNTSSLYAEVAVDRSARSRSVKKGNVKPNERVSTVKIDATGDVGLYDDAATMNAAVNPIKNVSNDYEFETAVNDAVAPVYSDATKIKETTNQSTKDQKPTSPFAMNHANAMKSLGEKLKASPTDLRPDSGNDIYDDAAVVNMNNTEANEDTQYDDADDVYQEASTVQVERLSESKNPSNAQPFQAKLSNDPSKGDRVKHGKETDFFDEDMTLVENNLYGQHKAK